MGEENIMRDGPRWKMRVSFENQTSGAGGEE